MNVASTAHAATLASCAGSCGDVGTNVGNCRAPSLIGLVRERRVVGRDDVGAQSLVAAARDDVADVQFRRRLTETPATT